MFGLNMEEKRIFLRTAGFAGDSIVDGPGLRYTIFTQGCPHNCPGCHNPHTHDFGGGALTDITEIAAKIAENPLLDGVTLSGGEPFCQCGALCALLDLLPESLNVWCFTGYTFEELISDGDEDKRELLKRVDVLVDGRFELSRRSLNLRFRGSENQRIIDVKASLACSRAVICEIETHY
jgi:anaerobic ribonucleoside-triphosphate reductase activating protein